MTNIITFRGNVSSEDYGIFVKINPGRLVFTFGSFTNPKKGATLDAVAAEVLQSITGLPATLLGSVTAAPTAAPAGAAAVQINGAEEVECEIISDIQIGQPGQLLRIDVLTLLQPSHWPRCGRSNPLRRGADSAGSEFELQILGHHRWDYRRFIPYPWAGG